MGIGTLQRVMFFYRDFSGVSVAWLQQRASLPFCHGCWVFKLGVCCF